MCYIILFGSIFVFIYFDEYVICDMKRKTCGSPELVTFRVDHIQSHHVRFPKHDFISSQSLHEI